MRALRSCACIFPRAFARSHVPGAPCHGNFKTLLFRASKCRKRRLLELGLSLTACSWRCVRDRRRVTSGPSQTSFNLGNNEAPQFIGAFPTRHVLRAAAATSHMHPLSRRSLAQPFTSHLSIRAASSPHHPACPACLVSPSYPLIMSVCCR